ncbi:MAG TPA: oligopeptide transporter, OPT family [Candidatus Sulfotelmatobacter sp.]|nr:oligopeptide transporter, OPT family [Candidatus Sulfotelmatobacter sp.]
MRSQAGLGRGAELTWRGIVLGAAITLVFTAANVYLGLKVGLTFASSIPAAVISMAVLRWLRNATIYENNIVQTIASAAGTLSSIIFVLPGLVMVGWWTGFPFWQSFGVCAIGGVLGVMYSVPLRRALVVESDLPYPEGVAAAEVLRVGSSEGAAAENRAGLWSVVWGAIASAGFAAATATQVVAGEIDGFFRAGAVATGNGIQYSLALLGVGHLVGLSVGVAMLVGVVIAWGAATPILTALHPAVGDAATIAVGVWRHQVRFIGAGEIGIAAIWALAKLAGPVTRGVASALATARRVAAGEGADLPRTEQDIPIGTVALVSLVMVLPLAALLVSFLAGGALGDLIVPLTIGAVVYVVIAGFLVAAACGYMAGLIGSSNSPVSGLAILTVVGAALLLLAVAHRTDPHGAAALVAFALFVTAVVLCVATIANDNLQDLKTGQLVDATPWRQQVALVIGVIVGAAIIPPILGLLQAAYGFTGPHALPAPQATLISALAKGVIEGQIDWGMIGIGALLGVVMIALDQTLGLFHRMRLPPLAVGLGIYLPAATITPIVLGALVGRAYERWVTRSGFGEAGQRLGVLLASGLIVGESLFGVVLAGLIVVTRKEAPLALVGDSFQPVANWLGTIVFAIVVVALYRWVGGMARRANGTIEAP